MTDEENILRRESWYAKYQWLKCGVECGNGWDDLLDKMFLVLHSHWSRMNCHEDERFSILQVKEKFGTLRVYESFGDDFVRGAIAMAEGSSSFICERCGASGARLTGKGWLSTRCTKCTSEMNQSNLGDMLP